MRGEVPEIRWVSSETLHMTLKFHGEIQPDMVEALKKELAAIKPNGSFAMGIEGVNGFPGLDRPDVIWAGIKADTARLNEVREQVEMASLRIGVKREKRRLRPHVTLGRNKSGKPLGAVALELLTAGPPRLEPWSVSSVTLMRSELFPRGPKYTPHGSYKI